MKFLTGLFSGFVIFLVLTIVSIPGFAEMAPPAQIIEDKVFPDCLIVQPSYLGNQPAGWGTGDKGPAVAITNKCSENATISDVLTASVADRIKTPVPPMGVELKSTKEVTSADTLGKLYSGFIYASDGEECNYSLMQQSKYMTRCKNLLIHIGDTLTLPMPWGMYYAIHGNFISSENPSDQDLKISIEGKMINPYSPEEELKTAQ